jgi:surfeit locus 1 family protein
MLALTGVFVALGVWQLNRLAEKEALIATVEARFHNAPVPFPPSREWVGFDPEAYDYLPVRITGHYVPAQTVLVFTSLSEPRGQYDGAGYWVMEPFALSEGGTVFVNRGFVPQRMGDAFTTGGTAPAGEVTLTGIARKAEGVSAFTPPTDPARRLDYVRDPARLAAMSDPALAPVAPVYVDLPAGDPGALPQGGETVIAFPNNHFGYALTWFGFAILTPILLAYWLYRQWRPKPEAAP